MNENSCAQQHFDSLSSPKYDLIIGNTLLLLYIHYKTRFGRLCISRRFN